uniref:T-box domain-containing protein n=1 Tax=Caenorhabditis tropicalis TaxID=1561998 RepID=A0A1I7UP81_9PELO
MSGAEMKYQIPALSPIPADPMALIPQPQAIDPNQIATQQITYQWSFQSQIMDYNQMMGQNQMMNPYPPQFNDPFFLQGVPNQWQQIPFFGPQVPDPNQMGYSGQQVAQNGMNQWQPTYHSMNQPAPYQMVPLPQNPVVQPNNVQNPSGVQYQQNQVMNGNQNVTVELNDPENHWRNLHELTNEMKVVLDGRNMYPILELTIKGLLPTVIYIMAIKLYRTSPFTMKYSAQKNSWEEDFRAKAKGPDETNEVCLEQERTGYEWMKTGISFEPVKIFNDPVKKGKVFKGNLKTMLQVTAANRYKPVVTVYRKTSDGKQAVKLFSLPDTEFIVVTGHKNEDVSRYKTLHNKYTTGGFKKKAMQPKKEEIDDSTPDSSRRESSASSSTTDSGYDSTPNRSL